MALAHDRVPDPRGAPLWKAEPAESFAGLEGEHVADVCVVGLGGSGLTCARELATLGAHVIGLDAREVGSGAAGRNGGFLLAGLASFHHDAVARFGRDRATRLYRLTLDEIERIADETPGVIARTGSLRIAESDDERSDCDEQLAAMRRDNLPAEAYSGPEGDGLLIPGDGAMQPWARCQALVRAARAAGAQLHEHSVVTALEPGVVRTAHGAVRCRFTVVAVDGGLEVLLPELSDRVRTARLQMLATAPEHAVRFTRPVYTRWGYDYWQQQNDGCIALGGGRDLDMQGEWTSDAAPTALIQAHLERRLRETLGVSAPITHRWGASVSYTDDGLPVASEVRGRVWAIGAYSGTGNVVGSLLGRGIARQLTRGDDSLVRPFGNSHG